MSTAIKTPSKAARCVSIDFWRIVFTLMIVICHASDIFPYMPDVFPTNGRPMRGAYIAVEFFGIVSGYLMVASARKQERRNKNMDLGTETICFMKRKIGKIYPYFFVSVIISFVLRQLFDRSSVRQVLSRAVKSIWELLLIRMSGINGYYNVSSAWYLSAMFIIMLAAYPLLRKTGNVFTHIIAPLTAILCMGHMSMVVKSACANIPPISGAWGMIRIIIDISIGCICYVICEAITKLSFASWASLKHSASYA